MYLLIETGDEGIEDLCYLSDSSVVILDKRKEFIAKKISLEAELWKNESPEFREERMPSEERISDYFCVQQWDGEKFNCACSKLGVSPSSQMLR
jgi:hypothetical protein